MVILDFEVDNDMLENNLLEFSNTLRTLLYNEDHNLFELIDITDDALFLDPALFYYFAAKENNLSCVSILQLLWGYIPVNLRPELIEVLSDSNGIIYLPNH